ncbi:MAG: acyl-CoA thioesterase [bacterium]|nr:acyl-CoA thioesterase [bacterium]
MPNIPDDAVVSVVEHRVAFFETDAMKIVHHSNYIRWFELARVEWLDEWDEPYRNLYGSDIHYATTKVNAEYHQSARFDDRVQIHTWLEWARGASLCMAYSIDRGDTHLVSGFTEHAAVSGEGKVRRIPKENRERLRQHMRREPRSGE